jgi:hypothetical protein
MAHGSAGRCARAWLGSVGVAASVACGNSGSVGANPDAAVADGSNAADGLTSGDALGNGAVSTTYPAFPVDLPHILSHQGTVLKTPVLVTVTWPSADQNAAVWEAFGDAIGSSSYWSATTAEYGVGIVTSGASNHVRMSVPLPAKLSYTDMQTYVATALGGAGSAPDGGALDDGASATGAVDGSMLEGGSADSDATALDASSSAWPQPVVQAGNVQTIYSLVVPPTTAVTDPGSGVSFCDEQAYGYHDNVVVGGDPVAYSVILECASQTLASDEETAAHEYVEAATNPYPSGTSLGYTGFDGNHYAWELFTGFNDELADACQNWEDSYVQEGASFPYWVQRIWSNERAAAGHDPCVPDLGTTYHGMTLFPSQESPVVVDLTSIGMTKVTTQGFAAKVGETVTFQVGFYSDGATAPWTISSEVPHTLLVFDAMGEPLQNGAAIVKIDKTSGQNGEKANVSITPVRAGGLGFQVVAITWDSPAVSSGYAPHYLPLLISNAP